MNSNTLKFIINKLGKENPNATLTFVTACNVNGYSELISALIGDVDVENLAFAVIRSLNGKKEIVRHYIPYSNIFKVMVVEDGN